MIPAGYIPTDTIYVTRHVTERLREHHPTVGIRGARSILAESLPVEADVVATLLQRRKPSTDSRYFLTRDRRGLLVVAEQPDQRREGEIFRALVTYIRFLPSQTELANRLWPAGSREAA